jgi:peptidyl-prolyl cis-trans isomerase B (cyclophilin B)
MQIKKQAEAQAKAPTAAPETPQEEVKQAEELATVTPSPMPAPSPVPVINDALPGAGPEKAPPIPTAPAIPEPKPDVAAAPQATAVAPEPVPSPPSPKPTEDTLPEPEPDAANLVAVIRTIYGTIVFEFEPGVAPRTVANFVKLANQGFYNRTTFHRVIPNYIVQGGDPNSKNPANRALHGQGGPGYDIPSEMGGKHARGSVSMARPPNDVNPDKASNGSQFFICVTDAPDLDGDYTVFGRVIRGLETADRISNVPRDEADNPKKPVYMEITIEDRTKALE